MSRGPAPPRLFVALPLPGSVTTALAGTQPVARAGVRLIDPADMHLTLHFLGRSEVAPVSRALGSVRQPGFALRLGRPGRFSLPGRKAILWVGIEPSVELVSLHRATGEALATIGFEAETRPYRPHVTVARIAPGRPDSVVGAFETGQSPTDAAAFECSRFALYESETRPEGARYRLIESFPLIGRG